LLGSKNEVELGKLTDRHTLYATFDNGQFFIQKEVITNLRKEISLLCTKNPLMQGRHIDQADKKFITDYEEFCLLNQTIMDLYQRKVINLFVRIESIANDHRDGLNDINDALHVLKGIDWETITVILELLNEALTSLINDTRINIDEFTELQKTQTLKSKDLQGRVHKIMETLNQTLNNYSEQAMTLQKDHNQLKMKHTEQLSKRKEIEEKREKLTKIHPKKESDDEEREKHKKDKKDADKLKTQVETLNLNWRQSLSDEKILNETIQDICGAINELESRKTETKRVLDLLATVPFTIDTLVLAAVNRLVIFQEYLKTYQITIEKFLSNIASGIEMNLLSTEFQKFIPRFIPIIEKLSKQLETANSIFMIQ